MNLLLHRSAMRPAFLSAAVAALASACAAAMITGGVINAPLAAPASPREVVALLACPTAVDPGNRPERRGVASWFR